MTAAEIYDSVTNGGASDFAAVVGILDHHGPWCLIGGLAVNCYVEPVYTVDADIVLVAENLDKARENLNRDKNGDSQLQIHFTQDPRYQSFITRAMKREVLGQNVPVADVKDVVQGKVWAWNDPQRRLSKRKKDELDLIRLGEAFPELRSEMPREIVMQLEGGAR
jgi:hypothetical protein